MLLLTSLALFASAQAAVLTLQSPRAIVTRSNGEQTASLPLSLGRAADPLTITSQDTLKITFQVIEKESGNGVQPHQTFLRFYDAESGEEGIQPVKVTPSGKAKFELNMAKPPASLPPTTTAPLQVELFIGAPDYSPISATLFYLTVPASQPPISHPDEASYHLRPEIHHTFRPDQKLPPKFISAVSTLLVIAPWVVLLGLWSQISYKTPYLFSPSILPFTASLGAFEGLLLWYWVDLKLGQVLLYGSILGLVTLFTGRSALATVAERRLAQK
ncbi:oligosaccharyl transferase delta subunit [Flagelloscypha sp. PMI_526]|nr:oligosaccharyl transferase delta subunit [Flagelloscypha sp. PMI_526]